MTLRLVTVLYGLFGAIYITFAQQRNGLNGPEFGFARPLNDPNTVDPDPFGRNFFSGSESMPNLESLANVPLDFLGGTTVRPPDPSLNNLFDNITPPDSSRNNQVFSNGNFLDDMLSGTNFQLPPGTNNDFPPNNTIHSTDSAMDRQREVSMDPELPDLRSMMAMSDPSTTNQVSSDLTRNQPNPNDNSIFQLDLPHEQLPPSLTNQQNTGSPASSVIRDWLSITSGQDQPIASVNSNPADIQPSFPSFPSGQQLITGSLASNGNQPPNQNIMLNQNNLAADSAPQMDMWSHNSLFNSPNLREPSDVFGNMNIPINFPLGENVAQNGRGGQHSQSLSDMNANRIHVNQPLRRASLNSNIRQPVNRPLLPPPRSTFQPRIPTSLPQIPNVRQPIVNEQGVFRIGGGPPVREPPVEGPQVRGPQVRGPQVRGPQVRGLPVGGPPVQQDQINLANGIEPQNLARDVFQNPSRPANNAVNRFRNEQRNNFIGMGSQGVISPTLPNIRQNFNALDSQRIQQQLQQQVFPGVQPSQSQSTAMNSFAPLPRPLLTQRTFRDTVAQRSTINRQNRPAPVNNLDFPTLNNPFIPNSQLTPNLIPMNIQRNLDRTRPSSIPVENGNAARFINDQRTRSLNTQVWDGIQDRSQNFGRDPTVFSNNQIGRRSNAAFVTTPQFRINQGLPQSLRRGLPNSPRGQLIPRNTAPTLRPPFRPSQPPVRFPNPSQIPLNRIPFQNSPTPPSFRTDRRGQRQRGLQRRTQGQLQQGGPPFDLLDPLLFLPFQDFLQDPLAFELFDNFNEEALLFLQDPSLPLTNNLFNPLLDISDRRTFQNRRRPQFPSRQTPNRMRINLPLNQQTNNNPFGIRQIAPPVSPIIASEELPFMGSGFFNPRVMMFSDVEVKPSSKKRIKPVSKQNATQNLLEKATMQGLRKIEYINTPVVKENRVF